MFKLIKYNNRLVFIQSFLINLASMIAILILPFFTGKFIDTVPDNNWSHFIGYALFLIVLNGLLQYLNYWSDKLQGRAESCVWKNITKITLDNLANYDVSRSDLSSQTIVQELGQNFEMISDYFHSFPISFSLYILRALVTFILLSFLSPMIALMVLLLVPFFILSSQKYADRLSDLNATVVEDMKSNREYLSDLSDISASERFCSQKSFIDFGTLLTKYGQDKQKYTSAVAIFENFLSYSFLNLMILLATLISGYQVFKGELSLGNFFAIQLYVSQFWTPVEYFITSYQDYSANKTIIVDFLDFLSPTKISYRLEKIDSIRLENYVGLGREREPLHLPLNYTFKKGGIYVIEGANGVGKTHLLHAILGLNPAFSGRIFLPDFAQNLDFAYCPSKPKSSPFYRDEISKGASMGQLKRYQVLQTLQEKKSVYLFDEPSNFLDEEHKVEIVKTLKTLSTSDNMLIIVSHDPIFRKIASDLVRIEQG